MFFDACDGLFTNYNWTEQSLEGMESYGGTNGRQADIYVGVDVFARGQVVGGMFETNKVVEQTVCQIISGSRFNQIIHIDTSFF